MDDLRINIAACRANSELTAQEMADALHLTLTTYYKIESLPPKTNPRYSTIKKISELSGIPMNYIYLPTRKEYYEEHPDKLAELPEEERATLDQFYYSEDELKEPEDPDNPDNPSETKGTKKETQTEKS